MSQIETIEVGPKDKAWASVIWLHGLGADGHDFEPIVPQLGLPENKVRFIFPHAPMRPITINGGYVMRAWYDIYDLGFGSKEDEAGIRDSAGLIEGLIARENDRGVPTGRIVLAGFSQGGAMTLFTGLRHADILAGMIVLSAYLPIAETTFGEINRANLSIPVFMGHGTYDPTLPMVLGSKSRDALRDMGVQIEWREYPIPHSVSPKEISDIGNWLKTVLALS